MEKWEYKQETFWDNEEFIKWLNYYGKAGWELICYNEKTSEFNKNHIYRICIFKRKTQQE